jgi:replicative DNA helicase
MADEERFPFGIEFQKKLLNLLFNDPLMLGRIIEHTKPQFFDTEQLQWIYKKMVEYYKKYDKGITIDVYINFIQETLPQDQWPQYIVVLKEVRDIDSSADREYLLDNLTRFIKRHIFVRGYDKIKSQYEKNDIDGALETNQEVLDVCNKISLEPPKRTWFFDDVQKRIIRRSCFEQGVERIEMGVFQLDSQTNGGLAKGEMGVIVADAKVGKSIFLMNVGAYVCMKYRGQYKVLHINLEGREGQTDDRYDSRFLLQPYTDVVHNSIPQAAYKNYEMYQNSLVVCNMLDFDRTPLHIVEELDNLAKYNFKPDVVIVDYGDLLSPRSNAAGNTYLDQQSVYRDLKTIANTYNVVLWTASQVTRAPIGSNPRTDENFIYTRSNIADCYSKVRIADFLATLNVTDAEKKANMMRVYLDAVRDSACGQVFKIHTDFNRMLFYNPGQADYDSYARKLAFSP